jgi:hypothetical protein
MIGAVRNGTYSLAILCEVHAGVVRGEDVVCGSDYWARHVGGCLVCCT